MWHKKRHLGLKLPTIHEQPEEENPEDHPKAKCPSTQKEADVFLLNVFKDIFSLIQREKNEEIALSLIWSKLAQVMATWKDKHNSKVIEHSLNMIKQTFKSGKPLNIKVIVPWDEELRKHKVTDLRATQRLLFKAFFFKPQAASPFPSACSAHHHHHHYTEHTGL